MVLSHRAMKEKMCSSLPLFLCTLAPCSFFLSFSMLPLAECCGANERSEEERKRERERSPRWHGLSKREAVGPNGQARPKRHWSHKRGMVKENVYENELKTAWSALYQYSDTATRSRGDRHNEQEKKAGSLPAAFCCCSGLASSAMLAMIL